MRLKHLLIFPTVFCIQLLFSQGIKFNEGSWNDILELAKEQNKPILVDAFTTWCGPCKWMAKNTFTNKAVGDFVNANYIPYAMDMEKGEGLDFALANKVIAYPTILFFDSNGEFLHRSVGATDSTAFLEITKEALNPEKQLRSLQRRYDAGGRDKKFLFNYLSVTTATGDFNKEAFYAFWPLLDEEEKLSEEILIMMYYAADDFGDYKGELYQFFTDHVVAYTEIIGEESIQMLKNQAYNSAISKLLNLEDEAAVENGLKSIEQIFPEQAHEASEFYRFKKAADGQNEAELNAAKKAYLDVTHDWMTLNSVAWNIYETSDKKKELKYALKLITRSVEYHSEYANVDTKAAVLYKLRKYNAAKVAIDEALNLAANAGYEIDVSASEELKSKIETALAD